MVNSSKHCLYISCLLFFFCLYIIQSNLSGYKPADFVYLFLEFSVSTCKSVIARKLLAIHCISFASCVSRICYFRLFANMSMQISTDDQNVV